MLIAHRGGLFYRPENTFAAFEYSIEQGIEWVECDVRLSRDTIPVIIHDDRLHLSGGGKLAVRDLSYQQLSTYDMGGGESIPTLEDLIKRLGNRLHFDLEIKEIDAVEKVIALVREYEVTDRIILTSFIPDALQIVKELAPEITRGLLIDRFTGRLAGGRSAVHAAKLLGCKYFLPHFHRISQEWVSAAHNEGLKVITWTVNHIDDVQKMLEYGVDGLISDCPVDIKQAYYHRGGKTC